MNDRQAQFIVEGKRNATAFTNTTIIQFILEYVHYDNAQVNCLLTVNFEQLL